MIYDFRRRVRPFREERIEVFTDGNDDYTYVLKSFFPMVNINYGQLVKIRDTRGKLLRKERRIIYGDPDEDDIDTVNVENFNGILRERVGRLVRKTKCFSKEKTRLICAVTLFQFYWNFMNEFRRGTSPAMLENLTESLWSRGDLFYARLRHIN
jgi:IS1 family transposase